MMPPGPGTSTRAPLVTGRRRFPLRRLASTLTVAGALAGALAGTLGGILSCTRAERPADTIVMASGTDLESGNPLVTIHPLSRQLQRHALFVTLVRLDSTLRPVPYFARTWAWDAAHRVVTFALQDSLRWHDGYATTAADVAFTITAARDTALGSPRAADVAAIDSVVVVDPLTVRMVFREPRAELPTILAELPLVPQHLLDSVPRGRWRAHPYATGPVGNGPFRFASRVSGRQWRFVRNEEFPAGLGGPPRARVIVVAVVDEAATKFAGLVSGELDVAGVSPTMARLVQRDPSLELLTPPALFSTVLAFNTTRAPFDDVRVRRAVALSLDRARLVQAAVAGFATPAVGAIPPGLPFSTDGVPHPDTAQADALLEAAGWVRRGPTRARGGVPLRLTLLSVGSGDMAVEQLVQADLAARGIDLTIRVMELATFLATVRAPQKTFDLVVTGIPGDIALGHLSALFDGAQRGGALDYTGFHTAALDRALDTARRAPPDAAAAAWRAVEGQLERDMPVAWLYHARGVQGRSRRLDGVVMDLRGELVSVARWSRRERL